MIIHCHSKKKLRAQAEADAEAAIAARINRSYCKGPIKGDPPPDYELPPTYIEAVTKLKYADSSSDSDSKVKEENELRLINEEVIKSTCSEESPKLKESDLPPEISPSILNLKLSETDSSSSQPKSAPPSDVQCHI